MSLWRSVERALMYSPSGSSNFSIEQCWKMKDVGSSKIPLLGYCEARNTHKMSKDEEVDFLGMKDMGLITLVCDREINLKYSINCLRKTTYDLVLYCI